MDEHAITRYILDTLNGVRVITASENSFFFYDEDNKIPFITIVTNNEYDDASDLDRPGVFRLNIGIGKDTYKKLFKTENADGSDIPGPEHDYTALDTLMPHPVYGRMYWVCILNPRDPTFAHVWPLLAEAYEIAVRKYEKVSAHRSD